jgi:hypothetical protein
MDDKHAKWLMVALAWRAAVADLPRDFDPLHHSPGAGDMLNRSSTGVGRADLLRPRISLQEQSTRY